MSEHTSSSRTPVWVAPAALVVAVVAVALALFSVLRSPAQPEAAAPTGTATPAAGNPADAKTQVCQAFDLVRNAVSLQTNADLGTDRVAVQAVAANARLATLGGGQFLLTRLESSVSSDLADAVRSFATDLQYIGMGQLAGARGDDPTQTQRTTSAQATAGRITDLCK